MTSRDYFTGGSTLTLSSLSIPGRTSSKLECTNVVVVDCLQESSEIGSTSDAGGSRRECRYIMW